MKPPAFSYHDPVSVGDAVALLAQLENAKVLAGGQSLMPMLNMRFVLPDHLIDLGRIEGLSGIRETADALEVGAMTRQRDLEFSGLVAARLPILREALDHVGHRQTRNRGTIGGSLCHLDPSAELVAICAALDAVVTIVGPNGARPLGFAAFPLAFMMPAIEPDELLTAVRLPWWPPGHGWGFVEFARRHGDYALVSAAALLLTDATGRIVRASLTLGGIATAPLRVTEAERLLLGNRPDDALFRAAGEICRKLDAMGDALVPATYRQHLAAVMTRRALAKAWQRLGERHG